MDEANSLIGLVLAASELPEDVRRCLTSVQHDLFELGGELCIPGHSAIQDSFVDRLESELDRLNAGLPALEDFVLPGGNEAAAACHVARTVVRRAERRVATLHAGEPVRPEVLRYINRLSDLLFVIARTLVRRNGAEEVIWDRDRTY